MSLWCRALFFTKYIYSLSHLDLHEPQVICWTVIIMILCTFDNGHNRLRETQGCCRLWTPLGIFSSIFPFLPSQEQQVFFRKPRVSMEIDPFPRSWANSWPMQSWSAHSISVAILIGSGRSMWPNPNQSEFPNLSLWIIERMFSVSLWAVWWAKVRPGSAIAHLLPQAKGPWG